MDTDNYKSFNDYERYFEKFENLHNQNLDSIEKERSRHRLIKFQKLQSELQKTRQDVLRYLVTTSGMMFSILIALHKSEYNALYTRLAFALAVVLLGLGVLSLSIVLYSLLYNKQQLLELYAKQEQNAEVTMYRAPRFFAICQTVGLVSLVLAVIALMVFVVMQSQGL